MRRARRLPRSPGRPDAHARPQAVARPEAHLGAGARHRPRHGLGRRHLRAGERRLPLARRDARRLLPALPVRRCVRRGAAGAQGDRRADRDHSRRRRRRGAHHQARSARCGGSRRARHRSGRVGSGPGGPAPQPPASARGPAAGARAHRRGHGQRGLRQGAWHGAGRDLQGAPQRQAARAQGGGRRALAGVHLRAGPRRPDARRPALRRAVDVGEGAGRPVRPRRCLQCRHARTAPGRLRARGAAPARRAAGALWRHQRLRPQGPALARLPRRGAETARCPAARDPADLPAGVGLPHQHHAVAHGRARARADRPSQGAGLWTAADRSPLHQDRAGDHGRRHRHRLSRRRPAGSGPDAALRRFLPLPVPDLPPRRGRLRHRRAGDGGRRRGGRAAGRAPGAGAGTRGRHAAAGAAALPPHARGSAGAGPSRLAAHRHGAAPYRPLAGAGRGDLARHCARRRPAGDGAAVVRTRSS